MKDRARIALQSVLFSALLGSPALFAFPLPQDGKSPCAVNLNLMNRNPDLLAKESQLGQLLAKEVELTFIIVDDPTTTQYLNRLAQNLATKSAPFPITVKIIDSAAHNELILPGGFLYIDNGLILQAETESELVGVLAYGVAYTTLRCRTEQATVGPSIQVCSMPTTIFEPYGWAGYGIYEGMNLANPPAYLDKQRKFVIMADRIGLHYLHGAAYDPTEFVRWFERISLQNAAAKEAQNASSPFPPMSLRLDCMRKEIAEALRPREEVIISSTDFERMKERLSSRARIVLSPTIKPKESATKGGAPVWIEATRTNVSEHMLRIITTGVGDPGEWVYEVDIHNAKGDVVRRPQSYRGVSGYGVSGALFRPIHLQPGDGFTDSVDVTKLYDLSLAGEYTVQFRVWDFESKMFVKSNTVTVRITP